MAWKRGLRRTVQYVGKCGLRAGIECAIGMGRHPPPRQLPHLHQKVVFSIEHALEREGCIEEGSEVLRCGHSGQLITAQRGIIEAERKGGGGTE